MVTLNMALKTGDLALRMLAWQLSSSTAWPSFSPTCHWEDDKECAEDRTIYCRQTGFTSNTTSLKSSSGLANNWKQVVKTTSSLLLIEYCASCLTSQILCVHLWKMCAESGRLWHFRRWSRRCFLTARHNALPCVVVQVYFCAISSVRLCCVTHQGWWCSRGGWVCRRARGRAQGQAEPESDFWLGDTECSNQPLSFVKRLTVCLANLL